MSRYGLVVIGAGAAGLEAARYAARRGVKVALIERAALGGSFLNVGDVPSKALLRTSRLYADLRILGSFGVREERQVDVDFAAAMQRMNRIRDRIGRGDAAQAPALEREGLEVIRGAARFVAGDAVKVGRRTLRFDKALIATGTRPVTPKIPGLAKAGYLTNETVFALKRVPKRLLVIGGGPLGCELAQAFVRLGAHTTIVHTEPLFLPNEERDAAQLISDAFARDGVEIHLDTRAIAVRAEHGKKRVELLHQEHRQTITVDEILTGMGRAPNVEGLGLERAGIDVDGPQGIIVDAHLRTTNRRIFAAGDVCLEHKYTHSAVAAGRLAVDNALFRGRRKFSDLVIPWCTYTDPEVAHVGLYVGQAQAQGIPIKTFAIPMHDVDRAIIDAEEHGFVKIHVRDGTDEIVGATIVARHAGEMINELSLAMVAGIGLSTLARVIHAYPTQAGAIHQAAEAFVRSRTRRSMYRTSRAFDRGPRQPHRVHDHPTESECPT